MTLKKSLNPVSIGMSNRNEKKESNNRLDETIEPS